MLLSSPFPYLSNYKFYIADQQSSYEIKQMTKQPYSYCTKHNFNQNWRRIKPWNYIRLQKSFCRRCHCKDYSTCKKDSNYCLYHLISECFCNTFHKIFSWFFCVRKLFIIISEFLNWRHTLFIIGMSSCLITIFCRTWLNRPEQ